MDTVGNFLLTWVILGCLFFAIFFVSEFVAVTFRPNYLDWIKSHKSEPKGRIGTLRFITLWVLSWPMPAYMILMGLAQGKTLLEYLDAKEAKAKAAKKEAEKIVADARAQVATAPFHWVRQRGPGVDMMMLTRQLPAGSAITHAIFAPHDTTKEILCMRVMPNPLESFPFATYPNQVSIIDAATAECVNDQEWAFLCIPGMESHRRRAWLEAKRKMTK